MNLPAPKTVGVAVNLDKPEAHDRLAELLRLLRDRGVQVLLEHEASALAEIGRRADLVVVLGGDGTILRVARELGAATPPIVGVNLGSLGFLASVRAEEMNAVIPELLGGRYAISERQRLAATVLRGGGRLGAHVALNDAVISRGAFSRIVRLKVSIDGEWLTEYVCDGMIFASATGSTAYSLSAGGPILMPAASAFVITPICPHALSNRSVIAGGEAVARCQVVSAAGELLLTVDGQEQMRLQVGDEVEVRRAPHPVRLVEPAEHSYFEVLRQKLKWSGSNV
jgi:NAD+ kinase